MPVRAARRRLPRLAALLDIGHWGAGAAQRRSRGVRAAPAASSRRVMRAASFSTRIGAWMYRRLDGRAMGGSAESVTTHIKRKPPPGLSTTDAPVGDWICSRPMLMKRLWMIASTIVGPLIKDQERLQIFAATFKTSII